MVGGGRNDDIVEVSTDLRRYPAWPGAVVSIRLCVTDSRCQWDQIGELDVASAVELIARVPHDGGHDVSHNRLLGARPTIVLLKLFERSFIKL